MGVEEQRQIPSVMLQLFTFFLEPSLKFLKGLALSTSDESFGVSDWNQCSQCNRILVNGLNGSFGGLFAIACKLQARASLHFPIVILGMLHLGSVPARSYVVRYSLNKSNFSLFWHSLSAPRPSNVVLPHTLFSFPALGRFSFLQIFRICSSCRSCRCFSLRYAYGPKISDPNLGGSTEPAG